MGITHPAYFCVVMILYLLVGQCLSRAVPFYRELIDKERSSNRVAPLDGLRGPLSLSVYFLHASEYYDLSHNGALILPKSIFYSQLGVLPVTMFFLIAGYVFWLKIRRQGSLPALPFWHTRLGRLGGPYLFACVWLLLLVAVASQFTFLVPPWIFFAQVFGWLSIVGSGHEINHVRLAKVWLGPAWTLRYMWYFYLTLPALVWFARRRWRLALLLGGSALLATLLGTVHAHGLAGVALESAQAYFGFLAFLFGAGMIVASLPASAALRQFGRGHVATCVSLALIAVTLWRVPPEHGLLESAMLLLPFACICWGNTWFGLLSSRAAVLLGRISYSFYLLHLLVLVTAGRLLRPLVNVTALSPILYWTFAAACGLAGILVSAVSYRYLEYPFLHLGRSRKPQRTSSAREHPASRQFAGR